MPAAGRICAARAIRDFGDGFIAILLPVYLLALGLSSLHVGLIATLALAGAAGLHAWPLVLCGGLKILYDLLLLAAFRHVKPPEER